MDTSDSLTPAALWLRVSTEEQERENQLPALRQFAAHHGYRVAVIYELDDSAWNGGKDNGTYRRTLKRALDEAHQGKYKVLVVWALDRLTREGAEGALRLVRQFRERGAAIVSHQESWLNGSPEVQDILVAFAGWMAQQESRRRSERTKAGLARKMAEDPTFRPGRQKGARDKKDRRRSGYVATWEEGGARRTALNAVRGAAAGQARQ